MTQTFGPVMLDLDGHELSAEERSLLEHPATGGVILFGRNTRDAHQVRELCRSIREVRPDLLLGIDQEGGRVQRLKDGVTRLPPMSRLGQEYLDSPETAVRLCQDAGWLLGMEMAACGLDLSFAPVLDVDVGLSSVIGDRSFAGDPETVALLAGAFVEGLHDAGMAAVGKHFPGHGGVKADTHHEVARDERSLDELRQHDLVPFQSLAPKLDGMMPAHVVYPAFDPRPAGFSRPWLGMLRESLGFKGLIFSDDLTMAGAQVAGGPVERAQAALDAGCDMVLVCNDRAAAKAVLDACAERTVRRASRLRYGRARPDLDALPALSRWRRVHARLEAMTSD
ncbi:beta-N-acetylhexosaminidase [Halomonas litopenaei]|uniref:Beta-hexosaminidase n=2 Tax=Halomonas TaxID=2745 RepID=A0AAU7KMU5_9GAMM|nr:MULTISPECIES: beta-N-acetylhexosaminidase [Halomonas]MBR9769766.1 beta-N-acetylhexosaminidase [Gammaproteobacteria bacterium]MBR9879037.1 beta-N-acetylhexosaminidase [Gammaproteobacteria bacterium]MBS8270703.1 beta-N-acetylhexosaminidase [Halomonas litopenaei]MBY5942944.1 beta-N-acetylhexosaminidase [Halomonas sp. DP5N14-9]PTL88934.1 beta-N-acetylhexosaminidase [Halomonas litopenaei]